MEHIFVWFVIFPKVEGIHLDGFKDEEDFLQKLIEDKNTNSTVELWKKRFADFKKESGLEIYTEEEFEAKEIELSKNLKWRFHFHGFW